MAARLRGLRLAFAALVVGCWLLPAHAQLFADDDARKAILELRTRLAASDEQAKVRQAELNEQLQTLRRSLLELNGQLESARAEMARLRGSNEQLLRDVSELQRKQRDLAQAVDDRLRKMEPQKVSVDGREFDADPEEKRQYEAALAQLRAGDFDKAAMAFGAFQARWPASGYGASARYWQGNALYGKRDYKGAIDAFRAFLAKAPDNERASEAMLAIANSQAEMKDKAGARKTLDELIKAYPKSEAAIAGKERLAALK
ncbi:MAG: tol-pal system protein YbgF [Rubrivivax sp.]|nr:tol-pal system protein YbgF [Rubrivivax sp.]